LIRRHVPVERTEQQEHQCRKMRRERPDDHRSERLRIGQMFARDDDVRDFGHRIKSEKSRARSLLTR
jgi:hypothetical protein